MSELLMTVMNGARRVMAAQAVNSNNLANASTDGFRAELVHITGTSAGMGVSSTPDFSEGVVRTTGNSLDIAVSGEGWIAITTPEGTEGYTRRGDLRVDALGQLLNSTGQPVIGNNGPIAIPPFESLEIGKDGTVSIRPLGADGATMAVVDRIKLAKPDMSLLARGGDGIMRLPGGAIAEPDVEVQIESGALESSNVNAVAEMLKMIDLARQFEAQVKLMRSAEENADNLSTVLKLN